jgi:serine/threonine-protein kinase
MPLELPEPGQALGKYTIAAVLGEGAMGFVYDAVHRQLGTRVAIKVLKPAHALERKEVVRFEREARAAASLTSPYVVRILDVDVSPSGLPYIVMERLEGQDIAEELRSRDRIPTEEVIDWALQVCDALADAHRQGIIHRDIKTSNVFLVKAKGRTIAKVLDFGISKMASASRDERLTATSSWVGTPQYMSPEQVRGRELDGRSDVWAVGVMLYRVFARRYPFEGDTPAGLAIAIATESALPLDELRPGLPAGLSEVVMKSLEKRVEDRHASIEAFATALSPFGSGTISTLGGAATSITLPVGTGTGPRLTPRREAPTLPTMDAAVVPSSKPGSGGRGRLAVIVGVIAVLAVVSGIAVLASRSSRPRSPEEVGPRAAASVPPPSATSEPSAAPLIAVAAPVTPPAAAITSASLPPPVTTSPRVRARTPKNPEPPGELAPRVDDPLFKQR